jgi:hypothetical protein
MKSHCMRGHPYTQENELWSTDPKSGRRMRACSQCKRDREKARPRAPAKKQSIREQLAAACAEIERLRAAVGNSLDPTSTLSEKSNG